MRHSTRTPSAPRSSSTFSTACAGPSWLEHVLGEHRFVDVGQRALEADPTGIAERVYDHAGLDLDQPARKALLEWAARNQPGSRGHHVYQPEDFGLTADEIRHAFAEYLDTFPDYVR